MSIEGKLAGVRARTIMDTGAGVSIISAVVARRIQQANDGRYPVLATDARLVVANKTRLQVMGAVCLPLKIGKARVEQWFLVAEDLPHHVLIGMDALVQHGSFWIPRQGRYG